MLIKCLLNLIKQLIKANYQLLVLGSLWKEYVNKRDVSWFIESD